MDYIVKAYKDWKLHSQFQEIVPDMDDEYLFNEKQSIRESSRTLKKSYGSTTCCNHMRNNEALIRHEIEKTDTLQGIALKYGCTTEQIRRANRLFASDSLFLRQYLLVPVEKTSPYYPKPDENNITHTTATTPAEIENNTANNITDATNNPRPNALPARPYSIAGELLLQNSDDDAALNNHNGTTGGSKQSKSLDSVAAMTPDEENRKCINDFLNKIDTTISESRKYVEKSKEMITSQSDNDLFVTTDFVERRRNNNLNNSYKNDRQNHQNHQRHSSTGSTSDTAQLLNTTQMRRVQNSLKRLEKQQDEFFEL
ncbi:lysM and putative peptidoglycan-binding domain-containing protein 1-like isoform X1 [Teleopsis dalmanni]|uniref:lysM and putative peptidoglycan-binding domain-containing protein 1-like isoform X1 n=2 Tax=Teleopsis dalmanni TaxID=139649 RepID=UPI0018CD991E|nr:lysM and putative peptidoglycan-binding domain-containing protein 1-like isoform X1 [Teleopsis dalmanni]